MDVETGLGITYCTYLVEYYAGLASWPTGNTAPNNEVLFGACLPIAGAWSYPASH